MGLGAILTQKYDFGRDYVVAHNSQNNNSLEANYSSYEGKTLVAVRIIAYFLPYFLWLAFTLVFNHQPLQWLIKSDKLTGKFARWALLY